MHTGDAPADADTSEDQEEQAAGETEEALPVEEAATEEATATKTEYVWEDSELRVKAVLSDASAIPDDAKLIATPVTSESVDYNYDAYMEALNNDSEKSYDARNTLLYDIAFIKDGVELQPESGTVSVTFDFLDDQLKQSIGAKKAADVNVIHLPLVDEVKDQYDTTADAKDIKAKDINVEEVTKEDNDLKVKMGGVFSNEKVTFDLESFSVVAVYGRGEGATYEVLPPDADTFADSTLNLLDGGEFGELANFGLIAFSELDLQAHTNSNFAAKKVNMANASGTNNLQVGELFYIQDELTGGNNFNMTKGENGDGEWNGSMIVLGSGINLSKIDSPAGAISWKFYIDDTQFNINGPKLENNAIRQEEEGKRFIDLEAYRSKVVELSKRFSEFTSTKISKEEGSESVIIERSDATIASYNVDASDLKKKIVVNDSNVDGRDHVFIISIDAKGASEVTIPGLEVTSDGYTGEVSEWTRGNVILNIYDSTQEDRQYRGNVTAQALISASILCPYASFATKSNVNGQIMADKILIGGEFHRDSITFTNRITIKGGLKAAKELNGSRDLENEVFNFKLTGRDGAPMPDDAESPMYVQSELDGLILFGYITFTEPGEYKYDLEEVIPEGAMDLPDGRKFKDGMIYDTSKYTIGVVSNYKSETDRTLVIESYNIYDEDGNKVDSFDYDTGKTGVVTFKNDESDGKAAIKATKSFSGWSTETLANKKFKIILEAKSFVDKDGNEKWSGNSAQYKLPTTEQGQQWQTGSKSKTVEVSASSPIADFGKLSFIDQNGHADGQNLGIYTYGIKEEIPVGAIYSADGKTAVKDGIVYDATEHIVTVTFMKVGDKYLVTTTYDNDESSLTVTNDFDELKVEKKWFENGQDVTSDTEGSITYKLMKKYTAYNPSSKVKIIAGAGDPNNFDTKYEGDLEQGSTLVITADNNPVVKTYDKDHNFYWDATDLQVEATGGNTYKCEISDISKIKDFIAVQANNVTISVERPQAGTVPEDAVVDTFQLTKDDNWERTHTLLPRTGVENGKNYSYTYYVEETVPDGYTASYTNNDGINTGTITIKNSKEETKEGGIKVVKTAQLNGTADPGAVGKTFTVALFSDADGENQVGQSKTITIGNDGTGEVTFDGLTVGTTYYVFEMNGSSKAEEGTRIGEYTVVTGSGSAEAKTTVDISNTVNLVNNKNTGTDRVNDSVTITKKDQDGAALANAEFKLYAEEGLTTVVDSYTGGSFTISTTDAALASYLPTTNNGRTTLYLKETKAPAGYDKDEATHPVVITTTIATAYSEEQDKYITTTTYEMTIDGESEIDVTNTKKTGEDKVDDSVTITKKDQDGAALADAEFNLYSDAACTTSVKEYTGGSFDISTTDTALANYLPAKNGGSTTLYLKETAAPAGYEMDETTHPVVITTSIATAYNEQKDAFVTTTTYTMTIDGESAIDVTNTKKTDEDRVDDSVTITKKDQDGEPLSGAEFKLYAEEGLSNVVDSYTGGNFTISTRDTALASYLPTENGGSTTLYLKETKAPAGYEMDTKSHPVTITTAIATAYNEQKDAYVTTTTYTMTIDGESAIDVTNTKNTGETTSHDSVTITKKDQDGEPLSGAEFELYKGTIFKKTIEVENGGSFMISTEDKELAPYLPTENGGTETLHLKETKAPAGYNKDTTAHPVVITTTIGTEYDADQDKYITTTTYEMTIDGKAEIDVTNTQKTGEDRVDDSVTITKKDQDGAALNGATFNLYSDAACTTSVKEYKGGSFDISTRDTALANYLPAENGGSTTLYLKETAAPANYEMDQKAHPVTITTSIETAYNEQKDAFITTTTYDISIDSSSSVDIFNNRETGELEVTKTIIGKDTDKSKTFNFVVTLDDKTINTTATKTYGDMEFVNGVANISLKDGQSVTARNLPTGIGYTVVETLNDDSCMLVKSGDTGTISKETKSVARFKNCFAYGEIQFSGKKTFEHGDISKTPFSFTLYKKDGNDLTPVETVTSKADGTIEFTKLEYTLADFKNGYSYDTEKVFNYVIKEDIPDTADDTGYDSDADIQYDTTECPVAVTVKYNDTAALNVSSDKQTTGFNFTNTKSEKHRKRVYTGDENNLLEYLALMLAAMLMLILTILSYRKDRRDMRAEAAGDASYDEATDEAPAKRRGLFRKERE